MKRIIINFSDEVHPELAMELVLAVIKLGRIANNGKNYCYIYETTYGCRISADRNSDVSDTFRVWNVVE